mgnify:CR=1 FL=1
MLSPVTPAIRAKLDTRPSEAPKTAEVVTPGAVPALADAERATIERRVHFLTASAKLTQAAKASLIERGFDAVALSEAQPESL